MASLTDILESTGRCLTETEVWCVLHSSLEFLESSSRDVGSNLISPESLFIQKGQVRFLPGAQSKANQEYTISTVQDELQFLGQVISTAMDANTSEYSQELMSTVETMSDHTAQDILKLIKISSSWLETQSNEDGEISVKTVLERLPSCVAGEVASIDSEIPINNNLADEIEAFEQSNRFSNVDSEDSSISLSSRGSFYEDGMSRSDSHHSSVSDVIRRRKLMSTSSSNEHLKLESDSMNKKSQFYTPVRSRKTRLSGDKSSLPPIPRPTLIKKTTKQSSDGEYQPISPPGTTATTMVDCPELPPKKQITRNLVKSENVDEQAIDTNNVTPLKSLKQIQDILESSSAPDLLKTDTVDASINDDVFSYQSTDNSNDNAPPSPPATLPPDVTLSPSHDTTLPPSHNMPSSNDMPSSNTIPPSNDISSSTTHHEAVHSDTHIVTPSRATPLDPNIGETTFDYTGMSPIVTNDNNVSSDEFQLTPPPVPLRSPPRSDSETEPSTPKPVASPETTTEDDPLYDKVINPAKEEVRHNELGYALPHHVKRGLEHSNSKEENFEHTQTLDRQKNKLITEEMTKASSEGVIIPLIAPLLHTPERYSMPDPGYELIDISQPKGSSEEADVTTTSFMPEQNEQTNPQKLENSIENTDQPITRKRTLKFADTSNKSHSHRVIVHCSADITSQPFEIGVKPDSSCKELFDRIVTLLEIEEEDSFGICTINKKFNEIMYMEPTKKIYKYAPSKIKWKKQKKSDAFRVYFRVMYYFRNPACMRKSQTRKIHYNQVKDNIVSGRVLVPEDAQLVLATLSLLVDNKQIPDAREKPYFILEEHVSKQAIIDNGGKERTYALVSQMHSRSFKISSERAVYCYLEEAMKIDELAIIFYNATMIEKRANEHVYLGFSPNGVTVCRQNDAAKETIQDCPWKGLTKISSSYKKLMLTVDGNDSPLILDTSHYRRARYFVSTSRFYHQFSRQMRGRPLCTSINGLNEEERRILTKGNDIEIKEYEGKIIEQKILKEETNSLGFSIKNHQSPEKINYVEVESITKDGPAYHAKCPKPGDLILEVNKVNMIWKNHTEVGTCLKNSPPLVELTLFRRKEEWKYEYKGKLIDVTLERDSKLGLGFALKNHTTPKKAVYVQATRIKEGSPADKKGCPMEGDLLVCINDEDSVGLNHKQMGLKMKTIQTANLRVLRYLPSPDKTKEQTDSLRTIEVQYTGDEELSSGQPLEEPLQETAENTSPQGPSDPPQGPSDPPQGPSDPPQGPSEPPQDPSIHRGMTKQISTITLVKDSTVTSGNGPALPMSPVDVKTVQLRKRNGTFGFAISGRSKNPYRSIYINKITSNGPAAQTSLLIGDHLLSVNGESVEGQSYNEVFKLLRSLEEEVQLQVCSPDDDSGRVTVELDRNKGQLGIRINQSDDGSIVVAGTIKGSEADKTGLIHVGSEILQVNGTSFYGLSAREATDVLMNCSSPLYILLKPSDQQRFTYKIQENMIPETGEVSSPEPSPSQDKRPSPRLSPSQDKRPSPKPSPSQDKRPSPKLSPSQDKRPSPKSSPSQDMRPSPKPSPSQDKRPSPKPSPSQDKRPSPKPSPSQDKRPSPKPSPSQDKRPSLKLSPSQDRARMSNAEEFEFEQLTVSLKKGPKGFGFKIRKDPPAERENRGLYIASVDFDPALSDGRLRVGDEITKINGDNLIGVTHQKGVQTMRSVQESGVLTVRRKKQLQDQNEEDELDDLKLPEDQYPSLSQLMVSRQDGETLLEEAPAILQTIEEVDGEHDIINTNEAPSLPLTDEPPSLPSTDPPTSSRPGSAVINGDPPPLPSTPPPPMGRPSSIIVNEDIVIETTDSTPSLTDEDGLAPVPP